MRMKTLTLALAAGLGLGGFAVPASAHYEPVIGSLIGAGIGAIAGPAGAAVGAVIGAGIGATVAHDSDHGGHHPEHHARFHRHTHVSTVRYDDEGAPRIVQCDPEAGYRRPTVTYIDDSRPVAVRRIRYEDERAVPVKKVVVTKTKMRKVCHYEPVRGSKAVVAAR